MVRNLGKNIVIPDLGSFPYSKIYINLDSDQDPDPPERNLYGSEKTRMQKKHLQQWLHKSLKKFGV
jgi:hypothetical protein